MSKYKMTEVLSESEETLYEYLETHCEEYNNEAEDWEDTFDEVSNFECEDCDDSDLESALLAKNLLETLEESCNL